MKRFAIKDYGDPEKVFIELAAEPREMSPKHVRVTLQAFGINPYDVGLRQGKMKDARPVKFPYVLGNDGAGTVIEVGSDVTNVTVGDEVIVHAVGGTYGEEIVVPGNKVYRKPENMSWSEAAGLPTTGITAYHLLFSLLSITPDQTIVVLGASGGVGSLLVQLAKANGNRVLASASSKNENYVRSLGVDSFAAYDKENVGQIFENQGDVVIDATKGSRDYEAGMDIAKYGADYVVLNMLPPVEFRKPNVEYHHYGPNRDYSDQEAFATLVKNFEKEQLKIKIAEVFPFALASVIEAHERIEGHPSAGKLIVEK